MSKSVLFLSALDFKHKSIQVIKNTPLAYVRHGWDVHYVVRRDMSKYGTYYYETPFDPEGVKVYRRNYALTGLHDGLGWGFGRLIISKLRAYLNFISLTRQAITILKREQIDVVYGYEANGALAVRLLRFLGYLKNKKVVTRFQGSFIYGIHKAGNWLKLLLTWDTFLPLYFRSDLVIMTNDGTQGDKALALYGKRDPATIKFWPNGVDELKRSEQDIASLRQSLIPDKQWMLLTVCRLESWKRVDRALGVVAYLVNNLNFTDFKYYIVGEGVQRSNLEHMVYDLGITEQVEFIGARPHSEVVEFLNAADIMISTYDASNVGNPLLEAIRTHKFIFTLNNGDTASWITHKENGFIYDITPEVSVEMAKDIVDLTRDESLAGRIHEGVKRKAAESLWTWEERLDAEVTAVESLLEPA
jgi:glycosyltransferase involved in cell wall biosynthesis